MIQRAFVLLNTDLVRAYLVYVRPLVEYNSVVSSPYSIQDIETTEQVQKTLHKKNLPGFHKYTDSDRLRRLRLTFTQSGIKAFIWCGVIKYYLHR